jgi:NAD(P)H-dependent nitrite reductase large subunit
MTRKERLVVIGNGMAGARFVENLLACGGGDRFEVTVFGEERHGNYNRILLSSVLAGGHTPSDIVLNPLSWYSSHGVQLHAGVRVDGIDVQARRVTARIGLVAEYDKLVVATGSRPLIPALAGLHTPAGDTKAGVFVFRTLDDCDRILEYAAHAHRVAVIGGGLLGLEAARGLLARGLDTHVIHLSPHLMDMQLDPQAGAILQRQLAGIGLHAHFEKITETVLGDDRVTGLGFRGGSTLECDMVVIAAGIRPNVELAARAGLQVRRAIVVDDDLTCCKTPNVYAVGECAEHRGRLYGLVAPVWEQGQVLADRLSGRNPNAVYLGSRMSTKLKVAGVDVAVMGEKEPRQPEDEVVSYAEPARGVYKKLIVRDDRLIGAIVMGDGALVPSLVHAFTDSTPLSANRALLLFPAVADHKKTPENLPDTAQICDCNLVTKAEIVQAVLEGSRSLQAVSQATRAGTGCGSCKPEIQALLDFACQGLSSGENPKHAHPETASGATKTHLSRISAAPVTPNKIELYKREKDGLDVLPEVPRLAHEGWEAIEDGDRERLKWGGVFFRRQTPGLFMMRLRMSNGFATAAQFRAIADVSRRFGAGFVDITTRQQIQLRGFEIGRVPEIWDRLEAVGLQSLQTGMDNIRNVVGCAVAGLTQHELFDASPVVREFTDMFLRNKAFTNLPRKFNVAITGCTENCLHPAAQDLSLTPAVKRVGMDDIRGFNVAAGGKMGSGGCRLASPLNIFVTPDKAAALCRHIVLIFRDHGPRAARNRARFAFLLEEWGMDRFRRELERRVGFLLDTAGKDMRSASGTDHLGILGQKQQGLSYVGLMVPVGRITTNQLDAVANLADTYGNGDLRITTGQNLIIPNVPEDRLAAFAAEPLLRELPPDPHGAVRGVVSCTGIDYCHFALIETKELALKTARHLEAKLPHDQRLSVHWSGCPAGCGNHATADIGLLGKNARINGQVVDAVDVFVGGQAGPHARAGTRILEDVPCDELPRVLEQMIPVLPYFSKRLTVPAPVFHVAAGL